MKSRRKHNANFRYNNVADDAGIIGGHNLRENKMNKLLPCKKCGKRAIIETWSSGGAMYMAKCSNPDCEVGEPITHTKSHELKRAIEEWNLINKEVSP